MKAKMRKQEKSSEYALKISHMRFELSTNIYGNKGFKVYGIVLQQTLIQTIRIPN